MAPTPTKKELLLKAAKELFGEYGYAETTFKKYPSGPEWPWDCSPTISETRKNSF